MGVTEEGDMKISGLLLLTAVALLTASGAGFAANAAEKESAEKVYECVGDLVPTKLGQRIGNKSEAFREVVVVIGNTAVIGSIRMAESESTSDYFNYVAQLGEDVYQLVLFRKTGRFKYSYFIRNGRKERLAEGDCKRTERSAVFE